MAFVVGAGGAAAWRGKRAVRCSLLDGLLGKRDEGEAGGGVLVVGATGGVGRKVVEELLDQNQRVFALVRSKERAKEVGLAQGRNKAELLVGILGEDSARREMQRVKESVKAVVWAAGPSRTTPSHLVDNVAVGEALDVLHGPLRTNDQVIFDFASETSASQFFSFDDRIMGGISQSTMKTLEQNGEKFACFQGDVKLDNNGGFCAVKTEFEEKLDLSGKGGLCLIVRGDGKRYKVSLKNDEEPEFTFQADLQTQHTDGSWEVIRIPFSAFIPTRKGKIQYGEGSKLYSDELDAKSITSIGFLRSKLDVGTKATDFVPGPFELHLKSILAYETTAPRFVHISSAAVTRPLWSEEMRKKYASSYNIPIVQLNPGNVLNEKLRGEDQVRSSGVPYTILRMTALNDDHPEGLLNANQGDTAVGKINRRDAARLAAFALTSPDATYKTFEVATSGSGAVVENATAVLKRMRFDRRLRLSP